MELRAKEVGVFSTIVGRECEKIIVTAFCLCVYHATNLLISSARLSMLQLNIYTTPRHKRNPAYSSWMLLHHTFLFRKPLYGESCISFCHFSEIQNLAKPVVRMVYSRREPPMCKSRRMNAWNRTQDGASRSCAVFMWRIDNRRAKGGYTRMLGNSLPPSGLSGGG